MHFRIDMEMEFPREKILATLKENRDKHANLFKSAREGYLKSAEEAVAAKLEELRAGKFTSLDFSLRPPEDMTGAYDTAISMLELSEAVSVTLNAQTYRQFVLDEWDWTDRWLLANSFYSPQISTEALEKGLPV